MQDFNIVYMPTEFSGEVKIQQAGFKPVEPTVGFSWIAINIDTKTYERASSMTPGSVIVSPDTVVIIGMLNEHNKDNISWMKHGRDYMFSSCWIPDVLYVKRQLQGIRNGINE